MVGVTERAREGNPPVVPRRRVVREGLWRGSTPGRALGPPDEGGCDGCDGESGCEKRE